MRDGATKPAGRAPAGEELSLPHELVDLGIGQRAALLQRGRYPLDRRPVFSHEPVDLAGEPLAIGPAGLNVPARVVEVGMPVLSPERSPLRRRRLAVALFGKGAGERDRRLAQARMIVAPLVARAHSIGERCAHDRVTKHARDYGVPCLVDGCERSFLDEPALRYARPS